MFDEKLIYSPEKFLNYYEGRAVRFCRTHYAIAVQGIVSAITKYTIQTREMLREKLGIDTLFTRKVYPDSIEYRAWFKTESRNQLNTLLSLFNNHGKEKIVSLPARGVNFSMPVLVKVLCGDIGPVETNSEIKNMGIFITYDNDNRRYKKIDESVMNTASLYEVPMSEFIKAIFGPKYVIEKYDYISIHITPGVNNNVSSGLNSLDYNNQNIFYNLALVILDGDKKAALDILRSLLLDNGFERPGLIRFHDEVESFGNKMFENSKERL